jgi:hypothetical protein
VGAHVITILPKRTEYRNRCIPRSIQSSKVRGMWIACSTSTEIEQHEKRMNNGLPLCNYVLYYF